MQIVNCEANSFKIALFLHTDVRAKGLSGIHKVTQRGDAHIIRKPC